MKDRIEDVNGSTAAGCARLAEEKTCDGCEIEGRLLCLHAGQDLADFGLLVSLPLVPFLVGMVRGRHWKGLAVWFALAIAFFGYIEAHLLCRHCPAYLQRDRTLRCHANWGLPKFPEFDPRPMGRFEQVAWLAYVAVLFLYSVPFFIAKRQFLALALATYGTVVAVWEVQRTECSRCFLLSFPANRVPEDVRTVCYRNYPVFDQAREAGR